jgi:ATP-dependent exoDNAse (exonuclease V) alpha subunit
MAIFRLEIAPVTRSTGRSATSAAAYRAGESIRDERTGRLFNHSARTDVLHKEIILPASLERAGAGVDWARDRSRLWNTAERAERERNSRVAREYQVALPAELSAERRTALARAFSREIAERYHVAVDLAVHEPRPGGDPRNFHAHLLATTREITAEGLGAKVGLDMSGSVRSELGLPPSRAEFVALRRRWAELANEALRAADVEARIDHRSLAAQGIDREPRPRLPWAAIAAERRGERSEVAERIRSAYRARVAARQERSAAVARDPEERQRQAVAEWRRHRALEERALPDGERLGRGRLEEIRRQAVAAWKRLRAREAESRPAAASEPSRDSGSAREGAAGAPARRSRTPGDDFSL